MAYVVEIDENKKEGKNALSILRDIATKGKGITIKKTLSNDIDDDARLIKKMLRARKSGFVNTEKFLNNLKSQL